MVQYCRVEYSMLQYSIVYQSIVQYRIVQYSIVYECLKEDLKLFEIWNTDSRTNIPELCANRREWRKMIHKGAKAFQQDWEKARLERSQVRKELPNQRNEKVRIKTILI